MGFFGIDEPPRPAASQVRGVKSTSVELMHRMECKVCPLNRAPDVLTPKMEPAGSSSPLIYMLGPAPDDEADEAGKPFAGELMQFIKEHMPRQWWKHLRWNNVIRSHPGMTPNKANPIPPSLIKPPDFVAIECCRPSIVRDIEATKPKAIFGFGPLPLKWAMNETHPFHWLGRRSPVQIGNYTCWFYPFPMPHEVLKDRKWEGHQPDSEMHIARVFRQAVRQLTDERDVAPVIHSDKQIWDGVEIVTGEGGDKDLRTIEKFLQQCADAKYVGMDYETNALRPYNKSARLLTAALAIKGRSLAFSIEHSQSKWSSKHLEKLDDMFYEFLTDKRPIKIAHQLGFELEWSAVQYGSQVVRAGKWGDSLAQAYLINEMQGMLALEVLTQQYYGFNIKSKSPVDRRRLDDEPLDVVLRYNALDAKYHRLLFIDQKPLVAEQDLKKVYAHTIERFQALVLTQIKGIPIDQKQVAQYRARYEQEAKKWADKIEQEPIISQFGKQYKAAFEPTNNHDVMKLLRLLGVSASKSDKEVLNTVKHPVAKLILNHRKVMKLLSTYVLPVSEAHKDYKGASIPRSEHLFDDGKLHPIISTTKVRTWRTSSEDPNVQNWPKRGPNFEIRKQVPAGVGYKIVAFDYASIQARNIAMESLDDNLVQSFKDWYDIHTDYVEQILKRYPKWRDGAKAITKDKGLFKEARSYAKNGFVFPSFFGAKPNSISQNLKLPKEVVEDLQAYLWNEFPDIHSWQNRIASFYKKNGYVTGLSGHRRHAPCGYNELINAPIQADESLIVLSAMSALSKLDHKRYQPIMEIHDDLTFLLPTKKVDEYADTIITEMVKPRFKWVNVPLVVEMSIGDDWAELQHVGDFENVGKESYREVKK